MNDDMQEMIRQMDDMMAQLFGRMEGAFASGMQPGAVGYHIVIHGGGMPPDGRGPPGIQPRDAEEPVAEVHRIENEVKVIVELPGVTDDALRLDVQDGRLVIDAGDADRHYHTAVELPPVDCALIKKTLKNGVLEVTFAVPNGEQGSPETRPS